MNQGHFLTGLGVGVLFLTGFWAFGASEKSPVPPEIGALFQSAQQWQKAGQLEQAQADYQRIIESFPNTPFAADAQAKKVCLLIESGQEELAEGQLEILFSLYAAQTEPLTRSIYPILNRYVYRKDYERAVQIGRRALQLYPEHGNSFSTRAVMTEALLRLNRPQEADALVEEMFALYRGREDFVPFLHQVKSAYWKAGYREQSQGLCRRLLAECPNHPLATRILGDWICGAMILGQDDGVDEAIETLMARPEPAEDFLAAIARIQERYLARNDYTGALALGSRAVRLYAEHPAAIRVYRYLAEASAGLGDRQQASEWADGLRGRFGSHPEIVPVLLETGQALRRYGLWTQAAEVYQEVLTKNAAGKDHLCA